MTPAPIHALIFDFDGLIIDTESAIYQAWQEFYAEHGHELPIERFAQCIGTDFSAAYDPRIDIERLANKTFHWPGEDARREARIRELLAEHGALPGVRERLEEAAAFGIPCSVGSSSSRKWIENWLRRVDLRHLFQNVSCRDDVDNRIKPAPDIFLHAAGKLGVPPAEAVVLEDSLNGLRAATAAGMRCIVVPGPTTRHMDFTGSWMRVGSLADIRVADLARQPAPVAGKL